MAHQLRALATLTKDLSSVPSIHMAAHTYYNISSRRSELFSDLCRLLHTCAWYISSTQAHTHVQRSIKRFCTVITRLCFVEEHRNLFYNQFHHLLSDICTLIKGPYLCPSPSFDSWFESVELNVVHTAFFARQFQNFGPIIHMLQAVDEFSMKLAVCYRIKIMAIQKTVKLTQIIFRILFLNLYSLTSQTH